MCHQWNQAAHIIPFLVYTFCFTFAARFEQIHTNYYLKINMLLIALSHIIAFLCREIFPCRALGRQPENTHNPNKKIGKFEEQKTSRKRTRMKRINLPQMVYAFCLRNQKPHIQQFKAKWNVLCNDETDETFTLLCSFNVHSYLILICGERNREREKAEWKKAAEQ